MWPLLIVVIHINDLGGHRVPLLGVDEVGEEYGVPDEGDGD